MTKVEETRSHSDPVTVVIRCDCGRSATVMLDDISDVLRLTCLACETEAQREAALAAEARRLRGL